MRKLWLAPALVLSLGFSSAKAFAAEQHDGDIQPWKAVDGQVIVNGEWFEADFGDFAGGLYKTKNPGFDADTDKGAFAVGNWLWFSGLNSLQYWNGSAWLNTVPNGEYIELTDALGNNTVFSADGVQNPNGVIDAFDSAGDLHSHLEMSIRNASNALGGSVGAYWITLQLFETLPESTSPVAAASTPFHILFNRGLAHVDFELAVAAASAAPVPLPGAVWLFVPALTGLLGFGRRKPAA
ncbi:hypothetical protein NP590_12040 [Methylomonas sp. SURF-2]|uniref:VPLPA-CTERM sorting domain-containing protein n=1 Tax=Methylomonas subterranea TaxID=2952225 RepID=A0ABT1TIC9_9GAMM|nr:hypothetical protein [Methylomonas sp. SURF-2]MCQ8104837.1 hypothetical protein [Methylomonas sp. SURF-2]